MLKIKLPEDQKDRLFYIKLNVCIFWLMFELEAGAGLQGAMTNNRKENGRAKVSNPRPRGPLVVSAD